MYHSLFIFLPFQDTLIGKYGESNSKYFEKLPLEEKKFPLAKLNFNEIKEIKYFVETNFDRYSGKLANSRKFLPETFFPLKVH